MRARLGVVVIVALLAREGGARELRVGAGETYATMTAALAAAGPGDALVLASGVHAGPVEIGKAVEIVGEPGARLVGSGQGDVLRVVADGVTVRALEVSRSGANMLASDAGIRVLGAHARIIGNRLVDNLFGIYLEASEDALLEGNVVRGRGEIDVGQRGAGIHLYDSRRAIIRHNDVGSVRDGVYFDHSDQNLVEDNDFHHLRYGIHYMFCADNRFYRNLLRDSVAGAAIMYTSHVHFADNHILRNRGAYNAFGLLLKDCNDGVAERNVIIDNTAGIFLDGSHRNVFRGNLVAYNDVGVLAYASSLENRFTANDFIGNHAALHTVGRFQAAWAVDGTGNFWSDYAGYDLDGDGRGDVPHRLQDAFEYLEGNHPLLRLYLGSAAAQALATAERVFPVIPAGEATDPAPLMRPAGRARLEAPPTPGRTTVPLAASAAVACLAAVALARRKR